MAPEVTHAMQGANRELLMVTPYRYRPTTKSHCSRSSRARNAKVRILSNSLGSAPALSAQSGYNKFRIRLLESGAQLYEVRALLSSTRERPEPRHFTLWDIRSARQALCDGPAALLHRIHEL